MGGSRRQRACRRIAMAAVVIAAAACGRGAVSDVTAAIGPMLAAGRVEAELARSLCGLPASLPCAGRISDVWADVLAFYERRSGRPAWVSARAPSPASVAALAALARAAEHGLDPETYGASGLSARASQLANAPAEHADPSALATFDTAVTSALLALGRDVAIGGASPPPAGVAPERRRAPPDLVARLAALTDEGDLAAWPDAVRPVHAQYAALQRAITQPGADRRRLAINLERWRYLPDDLGARHILVNVPQYHLFVRDDGRTVLDSRVIVGRVGDKTPLFSAEMTAVVLSPYWNIPVSIARGETLPSIIRNPKYLAANNIEVRRRRGDRMEPVDPATINWKDPSQTTALLLRQRPGPGNALGGVKFLLPNKYSVYLHDTPSEQLFEKIDRAFSHGCIRVEEPLAIAKFVLADLPEWTDASLREAMRSGDERTVTLSRPLPVHLVYFTIWVDEQGRVLALEDVYGLDR